MIEVRTLYGQDTLRKPCKTSGIYFQNKRYGENNRNNTICPTFAVCGNSTVEFTNHTNLFFIVLFMFCYSSNNGM